MTITDFDIAQTNADAVSTDQIDSVQGGCCGPCDPCDAYRFKKNCGTRRLSAGLDPSISRQAWRRYQARKCGPLEYNIYNSSLATSGYAIDPRSIALADGLAPDRPPKAKLGFAFPCCLLEAKYSQPRRGRALYIDEKTFVNTARQKPWLVARWNAARKSPLGRAKKLMGMMSLKKFAKKIWKKYHREAAFQANIYNAFCTSTDTPYTNFLYICGESNFVKKYFSKMLILYPKGRVVHSSLSAPHTWVNEKPPLGC